MIGNNIAIINWLFTISQVARCSRHAVMTGPYHSGLSLKLRGNGIEQDVDLAHLTPNGFEFLLKQEFFELEKPGKIELEALVAVNGRPVYESVVPIDVPGKNNIVLGSEAGQMFIDSTPVGNRADLSLGEVGYERHIWPDDCVREVDVFFRDLNAFDEAKPSLKERLLCIPNFYDEEKSNKATVHGLARRAACMAIRRGLRPVVYFNDTTVLFGIVVQSPDSTLCKGLTRMVRLSEGIPEYVMLFDMGLRDSALESARGASQMDLSGLYVADYGRRGASC